MGHSGGARKSARTRYEAASSTAKPERKVLSAVLAKSVCMRVVLPLCVFPPSVPSIASLPSWFHVARTRASKGTPTTFPFTTLTFHPTGNVPLSAAGYAEFHPVAGNTSTDGRARNRRADIVILNPASYELIPPPLSSPQAISSPSVSAPKPASSPNNRPSLNRLTSPRDGFP